MATEFDIGPLTWVKGEIDQALNKSLECLRAFAANPAESTQLKFSRTHFHQAHGALQIVGLDGVTRVSEELENLIGEIEKSGDPLKPETLVAVERTFDSISAYLDKLLAGEPNQPLLLFTVYRDLAAARGKDSADPVDLYYPDLSRRPPRRERAPSAHTGEALIQHYRDARARYQRGLVKLIKKDPTGAEDMRAAVTAVEAAQSVPAQRTFWWAALGFFDALVARAMPDSPTLMRLCNRIEQQLKRLVEGSTNVADRLTREALFAVARARPATEHLRQVQETFELAGSIPGSFEVKSESVGQLPGVRAMRELITQAKTSWNKAASGHQGSLVAFRDQTAQLAARASETGDDLLKALVTDVAVTAKWLGDSPDKVTDAVAMEVATALLLVENATENYARLGEEFKQQVALMRGRLQGVMQGKMPDGAAPVLDEMSRRAQERLLMSHVVGEINTSLRAVEQALDAFFRDSSQRPELVALDKPVRQVLGALTMLNEDRAAAALSTCGAEIQRFASPDYAPAQGDFERVAGTLSGLGFYVDALQHGKPDFDAFMTPIGARKEAPAEEAETNQASASVEAGLAKSKRDVQALFEQWKKAPNDAALKATLEANLQVLQKDASLTADGALESRVAEMLAVLKKSDAKTFDPVSTQTLEGISSAATEPPPSAKTEELVSASAEKVDAELLDVYLEEAGEVLATIGASVEQMRLEPHNIEELRTIRRGFHTLKGSGRMVGLTRLGEAAWAVEQVMNKLLEEERPATPDVFRLVAEAQAFFGAAVEDLKGGGAGPDEAAIVALAQQVKSGGELPVAAEAAQQAPTPAPVEPAAPVLEERAAVPASDAPSDVPVIEPLTPTLPEVAETLTVPQESAPEIDLAAFDLPDAAPAADLDLPAFDLPGVESVPAVPEAAQFEASTTEPAAPPTVKEPALGPISLDFSLPMATLNAASDAPQPPPAVESPIEPPIEDLLPPDTTVASDGADDEVVQIGDVELSRALFDIFTSESREHLDGISHALRAVEGGAPVSVDFRRAAHTLAGIAGTVRFDSMWAVGHALEHMLHRAQDRQLDAAEFGIAHEALTKLEEMAAAVNAGVAPHPDPDLVARLEATGEAAAEAFEEAPAELSAIDEPGDATDTLTLPSDANTEDALDFTAIAPVEESPPATPAASGNVVSFPAAADGAVALPPEVKVEEIPVERRRSPREEDAPTAPHAARSPDVTVEEIPVERRQRRLDDDIDPELLPIFLEEAHELVPAVGQGLRDWRTTPDHPAAGNALQRVLHTLKGSARMCGAMALGELTHSMETKIENALGLKTVPETLFDEFDAAYDRMGLLFERMQHPEAYAPEPSAPAPVETAYAESFGEEEVIELPEAEAPAQPAPTQPASAQPASVEARAPAAAPTARPAGVEQDPASQTRAMLRVRADVIDRLVNEAGEVSIARSRIEGELRALKVALLELTDNTNRLRTQLREIEIQSESQMQSRLSQAQEVETPFDPLEFDRFTRFQEITRMMAESVNDVATVQQNILRAVGDADGALSSQSRLTRGLQTELMRIRMVPFSSVAERLYRIVRQAAKETDKRAVLDIRGGQVELDRSVLERITAPFEHMLRNSVAHGIESPATRVERSKPELGEIKIEVRQEGNEIMLMVSDDGAGLNLPRILEKARAQGLVEAGQTLSDSEVADFIFHPGFSTASEVSQLAGRGVGMDVVKSEASALGGRIETHTELGKGTRFLIYLPLTLAVTQAVLVRAGAARFAIPAVMVEQVRQVKAPELAACNESGEAQWQNRNYPFRYLPHLLGDFDSQTEQKRFHSIMFVRSGANVVAINVDEVSGAQEIVVKNTGPLLSRIAGITGATVLGSGEIVLIINPVILAGREPITFSAEDVPVAAREAAPVISIPTVMIVDDSLTVRKITGRLLSREGFHVLTAKDGVDAVEQLQEAVPDVMLVDIEMPRMDGFDLTRAVRGDPRLRHIPIIMITSRTAERHRAYAKEIGVNVYLGKPFQEEELLGHIATLTEKAETTPVEEGTGARSSDRAPVPDSRHSPGMMRMKSEEPTVIRSGRVYDAKSGKAEPADILVAGDTIAAIGPAGMKVPARAKNIDARGMLLHPGLVNAHTHGHGNLAKGMGDLWTLELLLLAGPWINGNRAAEDMYLSTLIGATEMLMKGCTACYDLTIEIPVPTPEGLEACARAYADAGMRSVVAPMVADASFYESIPGLIDAMPPALRKEVERFRLAPRKQTLAAMRRALRAWKFDYDLARPAVAPTIPHHCSDAFMLDCAALAKDFGVGMHSHVQESKVQVIVGLQRYGKTQTAHLEDLGLLGPDFTVAHGVWLDDEDMRRLANRGASVAHNPGSNMRLGSGIADVRSMLRHKVNVGIGTDGANCSDNLNMYEAMRFASLASKVQGPDTEQWLTTTEVMQAATLGSARALGFEGKIGRLEAGYKADIVFLDLTHPNWLPFNNATNQLVHTEDGAGVHSVMVGGRMVVEARRPLNVDLAKLARQAEKARERLERANRGNRALYERLEGIVNRFCPGLSRTPYHIDRYAGSHHTHQHAGPHGHG